MDSAELHEWELVNINNTTIGTYVLKWMRGSSEILMHSGASLHAKMGDKIHVLSLCIIKKT